MFFNRNRASGVEWLLVGLGNPGDKYDNTRHNVGFAAIDQLAEELKVPVQKLKYRALTQSVELGGAKVLLMKPITYMNLSGEAVGEATRFFKIPADHVLVLSDDVSLPVGKLRVRRSGSAGGHNGLKNIIAHLGTDQFPRIRVGVGAPAHPDREMIGWVIGKFTPEERKVVDQAVDRAVDAAACLIEKGVQEAQNRFN